PGPSFLRQTLLPLPSAPGEPPRVLRLGMTQPSQLPEDWWGTFLWAEADGALAELRDVAPRTGPPGGPPLAVIGPAFAGALSGLLAQEAGRQCVRLSLPEADEPGRPWDRPVLMRVALKWDPLRAAVMRPNELAAAALEAFGRALEAAARHR
ncbi:MAG TPA: hypothetical protein VFK38_03455, partial [Candidatus Limnocylindrales bacterium]|nr:hypothetical protein [Candidatus Limnocylindrales bacterium]